MIDIAGKRKHSIDEHIHIKKLGDIDKISIAGDLTIIHSDDDQVDYLSHPCPVCNANLATVHDFSVVGRKYKGAHNAFESYEFKCPRCESLLYTDPFIAEGNIWLENAWKYPNNFWFFDKAEEMDKYITSTHGVFTLGQYTWPIFVVPIITMIVITVIYAAKLQTPDPMSKALFVTIMLICGAINLGYYAWRISTHDRIYRLPGDDQ